MSRNPETKLTRAILNHLNATPYTRAIKIHSGAFQGKGTPDVLVCYCGRMVWLEVKTPDGHVSPLQRHELAEWQRVGAYASVVRSIQQVDELLESIDDDIRDHAPREEWA